MIPCSKAIRLALWALGASSRLSSTPSASGKSGVTREGSCSIPFNRPSLSGRELSYIRDAIENGQISGDGLFTRRCQTVFQDLLRVPKALLTTSCTDALEMAGILTSVAVGDEVILPSFTFVSTATAFVLRGAKPVFSDIRPDTLNMDETQLETLVTPRAKVILPVHYAGVGCEMDAILALASRHGIAVIEDNAHGLFGKYKGRYLGTIGCLGAQSFHETKNIICGEGGALLINDASLVERAEIIRSKGTNRSQFLRGQVDKYTWVDVGSSFLPSDILAAFLYAQLEARAEIQAKRKAIWQRYRDALLRWAEQHGVGLPFVPDHCEQSYHMFYLIM
ncbi:MAG: dTDP-4-amino-4,6-dideoxygalactose transaminase, partial [Planctomycetes bacterium]|nr:dTDP-4-amino-4,6-dideoxygalactose transaminase [Planctomycetota bacterium]